MINDNVYKIKSGISEKNINLLNEYLVYVEENGISNRYLSKIIDEELSVLYEPKKVKLKEEFDFKDLSFVYCDSKIIGHYCHYFKKKKTDFGYQTIVNLEEGYVPNGFPDEFRGEYIMERINGNLETKDKEYEKSHQK